MGRRVRVLWLIKGLDAGGAERLLTAAAAVRDRDRFEYEAVYLMPSMSALVPELEAAGVPVRCLGVEDERDVRWGLELRRMLRERPVDVVHTHSPYAAGVARLAALGLPRGVRPRFVGTEHNRWDSYQLPTRLLNGITTPLSEVVFTVSDDVAASMWKPMRSRAETVVHGVLLDEVRAARTGRDAMRTELGVSDGEVLVGTIANHTPQKDYPNLLRAARQLQDRPVRFVAVGHGPLVAEARALQARLGLEEQVQILGFRDDAVRVLAACDVFVLASRFEGLPVALMEALALGLPVVATAVGGVPDAVTDGVEGLLVAPGHPDQLAAALGRLVDDPTLRAVMARAAARRGDAFDIERAVRRMEAVYGALAPPDGLRRE